MSRRWGEEAWSAPARPKSDHVHSILRRTCADFFQATTTHRRPSIEYGLPWGEPCRGGGEATPRVGPERSPAPKNIPRCFGKAHAVSHQCVSGGKGRLFGGDGPECQPNNAKCGRKRVGCQFLAPKTLYRLFSGMTITQLVYYYCSLLTTTSLTIILLVLVNSANGNSMVFSWAIIIST